MKKFSLNYIIFLVLFLFIVALFAVNAPWTAPTADISISQMVADINAGQIKAAAIDQDTVTLTYVDGHKSQTRKESGQSLSELLATYGVSAEQIKPVAITVQAPSASDFWLGVILPFLLPVILIAAIVWFMMRQAQGANNKAMSFGQSTAKVVDQKQQQILFADVAGAKEAKQELEEVVEFLKHPKKFSNLGAKIPKGVLLVGPPGTGKTLLARAVAGEASVPFFNISGSEFVEMFVGVGASRVRDLFRKAKKNAPSIIFIDELDAVGRQRGAGLGGSHDEREQTLNQILVEIDGFDPSQNVIVLAATNRPDILDKALLRTGRFDRQVILDLPDINDRLQILGIHARSKPLAKDVEMRLIAQRTPGFSGADLANLLNEAAILAARKNQKQVTQENIIVSIEKVMLGPERRSHILSDQEKKVTAYHEAGHALIAHMLPHADPVHKVTIISRGRAAGYTLKLPNEDKKMHTRAGFVEELSVLLAGHAAETMVFGDLTTGASNDLRVATDVVRRLVTDYGMSDLLGPRTYGSREELIFLAKEIHEQRNYSEKYAEMIDEEMNRIIKEAYKVTQNLITTHRASLDKIALRLLEAEVIEQQEFNSLMADVKAPTKV